VLRNICGLANCKNRRHLFTFVARSGSLARLCALAVCVLLGAGAVSVSMAGPACACSCVGYTTEAAAENAAVVFLARATDKVSAGSDDIYEFAVVEVFKGEVGALTTVGTASDGASCGVNYEVGREYLLFVSESEKVGRAWDSGLCHGPNARSITEMRETLHGVYGPPRQPDASAPVSEINWWTRATAGVPSALIVLAAGLALGGLWWWVAILHRRRTGQ
jgi:hypothetical protein